MDYGFALERVEDLRSADWAFAVNLEGVGLPERVVSIQEHGLRPRREVHQLRAVEDIDLARHCAVFLVSPAAEIRSAAHGMEGVLVPPSQFRSAELVESFAVSGCLFECVHTSSNHALQRTARLRFGFRRRLSVAPSLSFIVGQNSAYHISQCVRTEHSAVIIARPDRIQLTYRIQIRKRLFKKFQKRATPFVPRLLEYRRHRIVALDWMIF